MSYNETRVTVAGIVASQVTHTTVGTGYSRVKFRMHSRERRFDRDQEAWVDGSEMFISVSCWRALADNVQASLGKGDPVLVTGKLTIKELPEGEHARQFVDIEATAVGPNLVACTARPIRTRRDGEGPTIVAPRKEGEIPLPAVEGEKEEVTTAPF
jgi:single-strand DNA-binding protein